MIFRAIIVVIVTIKVSYSQDLEAGAPCKLRDYSDGVCMVAHSCDWAKKQLDSKQITFQDLVRCGFAGVDAIICCKSGNALQTGPRTNRKSDIACDLIEKLRRQYSDLSHHVTNGIPVQLGEFPHMAAIGYMDFDENKLKYICGGSLISKNYILTAAHCVNKKGQVPVSIKLGRVALESGYSFEGEQDVDINVKTIIIHPNYSSRKNYHDIALIELQKPVTEYSKYLYPACLNTNLNSLTPTDRLWVTGWGIYNVRTKAKATVLLKGALSFIPQKDCDREYEGARDLSKLSDGITAGQVCAYDKDTKDGIRTDACQGDSGGPLNLKVGDIQHVVGVTSFGQSCGSEKPGVYTKVSHYLDWIEGIVWPGEVSI